MRSSDKTGYPGAVGWIGTSHIIITIISFRFVIDVVSNDGSRIIIRIVAVFCLGFVIFHLFLHLLLELTDDFRQRARVGVHRQNLHSDVFANGQANVITRIKALQVGQIEFLISQACFQGGEGI